MPRRRAAVASFPPRVAIRRRGLGLYAALVVLGVAFIAAASVWAAADYNTSEELLGSGETGATPLGILGLAALGGALIIIGLGGTLIWVLEHRRPRGPDAPPRAQDPEAAI